MTIADTSPVPRKLVIVGDSAFAAIACEYFTHDSDYEVAGFSVERTWLKHDTLFDLPMVAFEDLESVFPPSSHDVFVAATYTQMNRLRARLAQAAKDRGYALASYVSSRAFVWGNVILGEHCFIFEDNTVQPFVEIGDNVVLWSGNHIGHHSRIGSHCFVASHVVVSGFVDIGEYCFIGVNATLINNLSIANDCWIGPGVIITRNTSAGEFYKPVAAAPSKVSVQRYFKLDSLGEG